MATVGLGALTWLVLTVIERFETDREFRRLLDAQRDDPSENYDRWL